MDPALKTTLESRNHSSLGISLALQPHEVAMDEPNQRRSPLTDEMFVEVGEHGNVFQWARFLVSLYYNKIAVNLFGCVNGWHWYDLLDDRVFLGALPTPALIRDLKTRKQLSVVINLCAEFPGFDDTYQDMDVLQIRLPTPDFTTPSVDLLHTGVDTMLDIIRQDHQSSIYIHCKAGRGRSATLALCFLLRKYALSPAEAQEILLQHRPQADKHLHKQMEVRTFYKAIVSDAEAKKIIRIPYPFPS
ncbi:protein-tyrosine phosphatase-like protein [Gongronella butleri]|nr:protein-tyrosine phosphatase-like protein [Gongronella butleri]